MRRTAEAEAEKRRGGEQGRRRRERRTREGRRAAGPGALQRACAEGGTLPHSGTQSFIFRFREQASFIQASRWGNRGHCRGHTRGGSGHPTDQLSSLYVWGERTRTRHGLGCKDRNG